MPRQLYSQVFGGRSRDVKRLLEEDRGNLSDFIDVLKQEWSLGICTRSLAIRACVLAMGGLKNIPTSKFTSPSRLMGIFVPQYGVIRSCRFSPMSPALMLRRYGFGAGFRLAARITPRVWPRDASGGRLWQR